MANFVNVRKSALGSFYLYLVFIACYLPLGCNIVSILIYGSTTTNRVLSLYAWTLMFLNSSLNPVIYCWKMRHIRYAIKDTLRNIFTRRNWSGLSSFICIEVTSVQGTINTSGSEIKTSLQCNIFRLLVFKLTSISLLFVKVKWSLKVLCIHLLSLHSKEYNTTELNRMTMTGVSAVKQTNNVHTKQTVYGELFINIKELA